MTDPAPPLADDTLLDNCIWSSLVTDHAHLAIGKDAGHGLARRYPSDIGPLSALREPTPEAYSDLARITPENDIAILFLERPADPPPGWQISRAGAILQMVCTGLPDQDPLSSLIAPLGPPDFAEMKALATLTEPGPFRTNTATLGAFFGIRIDGRLAAMAGQRLAPAGYTEVSAVCTHPDFRGRGYAQALVTASTRHVQASGRTPFLSTFETNTAAIRTYQRVGFTPRRILQLAVLRSPSI